MFFGGFRCGVPLFIVILVIYINIKIGKIDVKGSTSRWSPVWETAVNLAVGGGVFDGFFLSCPFSH